MLTEKWKKKMQCIKSALRSVFFPEKYACECCGREVFSGERFCAKCLSEISYTGENICERCGRQVSERCDYCDECKSFVPCFDKARSVCSYNDLTRKLVLRFKNGKAYLARLFAEKMSEIAAREFSDADALVYVPITRKRLRKRGYNQARLLAGEISQRTGIAVADVLQKKKDTEDQKKLTKKQRKRNLQAAFAVTDKVFCKDKTLILVDDVMTTGVTVNEIAALLLGARAKKVYVLTFAAVPFRKSEAESDADE